MKNTKAEHPKLAAKVIHGRSGVERKGPTLVLVGLEDLQSLPNAMSLVWMLNLLLVLGLKWNPASIP